MKKRTVLIVDDEPSIRTTLRSTLEGQEYSVALAERGEEALTAVDQQPIDLVLLDLHLPGLDGLEVLGRIEEKHPELPVLIISAHGTVDTAVEAIKQGALGFIEKPFTPDRIRKAVFHALDKEQRKTETAALYDRHIDDAVRTLEDDDLNAALEHAQTALSLNPKRPEAFNVMGVTHHLLGKRSEAQRYFMTALALDPAYEPAQVNQDNLARPPSDRTGGFRLR